MAIPKAEFGYGLINRCDLGGDAVVITQPLPWELVKTFLKGEISQVLMVEDMHLNSLHNLLKKVKSNGKVVGIGGGMPLDAAKFIAWKLNRELILIATAITTDAMMCRTIAIRENWMVKYIGDKFADRLIIDFDIVLKAPQWLNACGIGDLLSITTALEDWHIARDYFGENYSPEIVRESQSILNELFAMSYKIAKNSEEGIKALVEGYYREVSLCEKWGNSRPEEGSEHFFAYCLEYLLKRAFLHGPIVCLGVLIMRVLQGFSIEEEIEFLKSVNLPWEPEKIGLDLTILEKVLLNLKNFIIEANLLPSIINITEFNVRFVKSVLNKIFLNKVILK